MLKNPTPQLIALLSSLWMAVGMVVLGAAAYLLFEGPPPFAVFLLLSFIAFAVAFLSFYFYLRKYIYRKIKLIYKTIHKQKLRPEEKSSSVDMRSSIIDEVEKEVAIWADNQAKEIQQLRNWQEYRRRFLGDISHELKTPIFNIQGYLESLLDGGLYDPAVNVTFLERAVKNVERLNTIVEDLEVISRLESGELVLELQNFDIRALADEVFDELEMKAAERKIKLGFKTGADQHFKVRADRESIRQVMINLVNNSIKYGIDGGSTKLGFYDMDRYILVEVADNGIGIPPEQVDHVFERFYRVDKSRSRERGGSGLGLSIVKHIIEAHHQTINVRSSIGLGSTFGFTLAKA
jgi:two-component system, OmpR family, phosphate regulon sensor histidine kinase PhoR